MYDALKLNIGIVGYRDWAFDIYSSLHSVDFANLTACGVKFDWLTLVNNPTAKDASFTISDPNSPEDLLNWIQRKDYKFIIFVGWSWIVPEEILKSVDCLCIHPSDITKCRGGSPIQNQILRGVDETKVTIFRMTQEIDWGPIIDQRAIRLDGYIPEIFNRIIDASVISIRSIIKNVLSGFDISAERANAEPGDLFARRKPSDSVVEIDNLKSITFEKIDRLSRCLSGPYPRLKISSSSFACQYFEVASVIKLFNGSVNLDQMHDNFTEKHDIDFLKLKCKDGEFIAFGEYKHND